MSDKKESNTMITDWLEKYGDSEIEKKVEERLEQITKEIMSNKKQSSVEWLILEIKKRRYVGEFVPYSLFEQAKAMHKEEIEESWNDGCYQSSDFPKTSDAEQYYNETFNK